MGNIYDFIRSPSGAMILSIVALILSVYQLWQAKRQNSESAKQTSHLGGITDQIEQVSRALSTRYLDEFPLFMPNIVELIKDAKKEVLILCDFPAYCCYSNSRSWIDYRYELEKKIRDGVIVTIACYEEKERVKKGKKQFEEELSDWEGYKKRKAAKIKDLLLSHGGKIRLDDLLPNQFIEVFEDLDKRMLSETFSGATKVEIEADLAVFCWVVDGQNAIFTFPSYSRVYTGTGYGFYTNDQRLITAITKLARSYIAS